MKRWFDSEEKTDHQPVHTKEERHEINAKTKMTYRYPKQGEFRFPVIPDQPDQADQTTTTYQRTRKRNQATEESQTQERVSQWERRPRKKETSEQLPETSSIPFTPTDVPSPIYGYQARQLTKGLQKLEYAVEEQKTKPDFFTDSMEEKQWEELRKRMRARVDGVDDRPPKTNSSVKELADSEISKEEERREEAATTEEASLIGEPSLDRERPSEEKNAVYLDEQEEVRHMEDEHQQEISDEDMNGDKSEEEPYQNHQASFTDVTNLSFAEQENEKKEVQETVEEVVNEEMNLPEEGSDGQSLPTPPPFVEEELIEKENNVENNQADEENDLREDPDTAGEQMYQQEQVENPNKEEPYRKEQSTQEGKLPDRKEQTLDRKEQTIETKDKKRTVPFNVLMTPRDKRTRDQKKKNAHVKEKPMSEKEKKTDSNTDSNLTKSEARVEYQTPLHLLEDPIRPNSDDDSWITEQMELLETTLRHFHVRAKVVNAMKGPSVTRFEVQPEPGVKVSKITNLSDDIKLSMAAKDIRIEAPIPGKQAVGIEIPNRQSQLVGLQEIFESDAFQKDESPLSVGLGLDIGGESIVTNLKKMPHGLIAGATGSGKSVCINTILVSLLYKAHHEDVKFLLIDPKMVELAPYNELPHLVSPVITDVKAATTALKWAVKEMEERYEKFVEEGVRDVERYNDKMIKQNRAAEKLPYLVIVIDELADLMMVSPQDVEDAICRIAQKARACGIHLLLATQRPSVDVITGLIKANIPTRIAFSVSSQVDSRTIIDSGGAEKLLGKGDMLFVENGSGQPVRIQGAFLSDDEIERVTNYVKKIAPPQYLFHQEELLKQVSTEEETDDLFDEAVDFVINQNGASASLIQRRFKVGYNRAARLVDQMESYGIISEQKGSKPRDVLLTKQQIDEMRD
ncbi:DNA translocase FtsK [Halobacillus dabanensis]|nr:DNA translocase FtsK [Halobacillus dabanensis]